MTASDVLAAEALVIRKRLTLPVEALEQGDGAAAARQLDAVLMGAGFKLSAALLATLSALPAGEVLDLGVRVLAVVREMAGDHVQHNVYFKNFPHGVPDTAEFWAECLTKALAVAAPAGGGYLRTTGDTGISQLLPDPGDGDAAKMFGLVNLLALPGYGTPQHTYQEMLAAHEALIESAKDRITVLIAGDTVADEASALFLSLAASTIPLSGDDLEALAFLAGFCADGPQPEKIPSRESRAVISKARLAAGRTVLADTLTDVLRLAVAISGGEVSLRRPSRLGPFTRAQRRALLAALDLVARDAAKLGDVPRFAEQWKRLGERLHPHEYPEFAAAAEVFRAARGDIAARSRASQVEAAFDSRLVLRAVRLLKSAPGEYVRSVDRLLRTCDTAAEREHVVTVLQAVAPDVSGRVLLSLREHLQNRATRSDVGRVFANRGSTARTAPVLPPLDPHLIDLAAGVLDDAIAARVARDLGSLVVDPAVLDVALPLSGKASPGGLGMMPRGSVQVIEGEVLRFFVHWMQTARRTDFDLSAILLDNNYSSPQQVSWTNYGVGGYATYSGDMTDGPAPRGANEFIDVVLPRVPRQVIIPQVYIFSGEGFDECAEAFFGFMLRDTAQLGAPFEARTVRMKSDLRGDGRVALPLAFTRGDDGKWRAKWMHLYQRGMVNGNSLERNGVSVTTLTRAIMERDYLRVRYLTGLLASQGCDVTMWDGQVPEQPVTFVGLERPEGLPDGSRVITLQNLRDLIPE